VAADPARPEDEEKAGAILAASRVVFEGAPRFSPDGKSVAFVANYDGQRALYLHSLAQDPPRRIAQVPLRFRRPVFSPDGESIYFTSDRDGDEAFAIRRIVLATGAIDEVTPGEKLRRDHGPYFTSRERMRFTARKMNAHGTALYEQSLARDSVPLLVFEHAGFDLAAMRPDGGQIALYPAGKSFSLSVVDLPASSTVRLLYPRGNPEKKRARILAACYSIDGARLFVATDDGGEQTHLLALDAKSGDELARFSEPRIPGGDIQGLVAGRDTVAYVIDLGTHHELRVLDSAALTLRPNATLPLGSEVPGSHHPNSTSSLDIAPDGSRVAVQWSAPSSPPRIYLVETGPGRTRPLTSEPRGEPMREPPSVELEIARVPSFDGLEIPTLIYRPRGTSGRLPVVVSIHGGFPFASTARFDPQLAILVGEGYAVVEPNVRGSGGFGRSYERADDGVGKLNGVRDFAAVARWIAKQPWGDSTRMMVMGPSAGGYYALMCLAHYPELWRAGVALVPLYDLPMALSAMDGSLRLFLEQQELVPLSETGTLAALSPHSYVDRIRAPLFVYAGAKDVRTPTTQIDRLVHDLRGRGVRVEYMRAEQAGHSRGDPKLDAMRLARVLRFIREALR
jgi:dipeptidyl aminopeptidase/acylaminoacyl peptidase